jgi:hypothetical protein
MEEFEFEINGKLKELRRSYDDDAKLKANTELITSLKEALTKKEAFDHQFTSLKSMGTIKSPDNKFRFFNWNIELEDQTNKYFCLMMLYDSRKKKYKVIEFKDQSFLLPSRPDNVLTPTNWYGALYYKIIPKTKGSKTYYTLLGYDGNNQTSTVKIIDAMTISGTRVKLGAPIFLTDEGVEKRLFFEYSKMATMSLTFDKKRDLIIMDHLAPESQNLAGFKEYYVPDFTYDAMLFSKGKWSLRHNVVATNPDERKRIKVYAKNAEGKVVSTEVNNKWNTPNDKNSPIDNGNHIAITPEKEANLSDRRLKKNKTKEDKNNSIYPNYKGKKKKKKNTPHSIYDFRNTKRR